MMLGLGEPAGAHRLLEQSSGWSLMLVICLLGLHMQASGDVLALASP
jgi:hypothetical protein